MRTLQRSSGESHRSGKEQVDPSSHKIWGLNWVGHNAYFLGKQLHGLSALAIFITTGLSSTELPTEAVEQSLCQRRAD